MLNDLLKKLAEGLLPVEHVTDEVKSVRLSVCNSCENLERDQMRCNICGCFLEVKAGCLVNFNPKKVRKELTHCPMGKWNDLDTANHYRLLDKLKPLQND